MTMRRGRSIGLLLLLLFSVGACLIGCHGKEREPDFSKVESVCELATLKCYYHNVAKKEQDAGQLFQWIGWDRGKGYKKIWMEYSGIVELGIDASKVSISQPDKDGTVRIAIPAAKVLSVDLDEESLGDPIIDKGFLTDVTKEEETQALAEAQRHMEETARNDEALLTQAQERAKALIGGYVRNVGKQIGKTYEVEWVEAEK